MKQSKELTDFVKKTYNQNGNLTRLMMKQYHNDLVTELLEVTCFLPSNCHFKQRMWHVFHETYEIPCCPVCNKQVQWFTAKQRYKLFCSVECEKRGERFRHQKSQQALLQRYGVNNYGKTKECQEKMKKTNLERYGVDNYGKTKQRKEQIESTCVKKYGVTNVWFNTSTQEKRQNSMIGKYNVVYPWQNKTIKKRVDETIYRKYGVNNFRQAHIPPNVRDRLDDKDWLFNKHYNENITIMQIAEILNVSSFVVAHRLKQLNIPVKHIRVSQHQRNLKYFLQTIIDEEIIENTRKVIKPLEIDLYIPSLQLGIEYNGLYRHSEVCGINRSYHLNKTRLCEEKGIRLIHIFENEWVEKQEIVKSRLRYFLNKVQTKIYARQCNVINVNSHDTFVFNNANHIQGHCSSSINYGMYHNNQLVALMTFGKARFNTKCQYELLRYSNKLNTTVIGGADKLFQHFIKTNNPESVISYSDKRWNTGNLYKQLGFVFLHHSAPNYFYFDYNCGLTLHSRVEFQKHKLSSKLEFFDPELTEWQNMVANGWNRIWDCGNDVWLWKSNVYEIS